MRSPIRCGNRAPIAGPSLYGSALTGGEGKGREVSGGWSDKAAGHAYVLAWLLSATVGH
ncbi:hypothetical protein D3C78_1668620 [compost metagenome]